MTRVVNAAIAVVCAALVALAGCHRGESETSSGPTASASVKPVDHLAPGELLESKEKAFGIPLPRGIAIEKQFVDVVYASGDASQEAVAKYFAARVTGGQVTSGARGTVFEGVHAPANEALLLRIEVATDNEGPLAGRGTRVTMRDITAPKQPELPDEAARWRAAGLTPDGKLADPSHMK